MRGHPTRGLANRSGHGCCTSLLYGRKNSEAPDHSGASDLCALGRIRTCNLLIRSQMLYPLSYECLCVLLCWLFLPGFSARSALREQHYMTGGVRRNPFAAPDLTCENSPGRVSYEPRIQSPEQPKPRSSETGASRAGAEAEGFEPSMGFKAQTALAVRRHRPD